jgi:ATP-dependent exoDNAse (exonuclease V) beta subunit
MGGGRRKKLIKKIPTVAATNTPNNNEIVREETTDNNAREDNIITNEIVREENASEENAAPLPPPPARPTPDYLARLNAHERDPYITFDEGPHEYTVHGEKGYTSVTTWNHMLFAPFEEEKMIKKIVGSKKWRTDTTYKYYQKTAEEISEMWRINRDEASGAGTQLHFNIECFYNKIPVENASIEYQYFLRFVEDYPNLEAYRTEWCVYHEELKLSGSIDMVFRDKETGEFYIYDWKRSKEIVYESYGNKTSPVPCIHQMPDCNFWHYSLQLNTYREILETKYGMKITGMFLICIHPDNPYETYERIEVHDLRREIGDLFEFRRKLLLGEVSLPSTAAH